MGLGLWETTSITLRVAPTLVCIKSIKCLTFLEHTGFFVSNSRTKHYKTLWPDFHAPLMLLAVSFFIDWTPLNAPHSKFMGKRNKRQTSIVLNRCYNKWEHKTLTNCTWQRSNDNGDYFFIPITANWLVLINTHRGNNFHQRLPLKFPTLESCFDQKLFV